MHQNSHLLIQILVIFGAAVVMVPLFKKLGLGSIIGYLAGGLLIGPSVFNFVNDTNAISYIGEFGVVFLLFIIGIEMKPARLWTMRRLILGLGGAQIITSAIFLGGAAWMMGVTQEAAIIIGLGLALSSTAMGLQLMTDRNELNSVAGRTGFAILLMQDLAVPMLLALVSVLAGGERSLSSNLFFGIAEGLGILMIALLISRYALKHVLAIIAASRVTEVFTAFALLLVLGMAWLMESIGLSLAMGAFLAGMFLANSEYRHQIEADIMPFRGLLLGLFFMSIGMSIDLTLLLDSPYFIITAALVIMLFKAVVIFGLARLFSLNVKDSLQTGAYLSQMGEFGFVLFAFAAREGVIAYQHLGILLLIITFSMILTPLIVPAILGWATRLQNGDLHTLEAEKFSHSTTDHETYDFIIAGFGRVGQTVAMRLSSAGYSYIAFDIDLGKVKFGRDLGFNVHFGNASRIDVLKSAHAEKARGLILTLDDRKAVLKTIIQIHELYPHLPLHARAHDIHEAQELQRFGVHASVPETIEASYQLGLSAITYNEDEDAERIQIFKDQIGLSRDTGYQDILDHYGPVKR